VARDREHAFVTCDAVSARVVDTTGAGDVYHAGYLFGLLEGWALPRRMAFASAAAALACTRLGARGHLPARAEVEALVAGQKVGSA
jgi:sugar/nucleoside kinase (ribokinase family)